MSLLHLKQKKLQPIFIKWKKELFLKYKLIIHEDKIEIVKVKNSAIGKIRSRNKHYKSRRKYYRRILKQMKEKNK